MLQLSPIRRAALAAAIAAVAVIGVACSENADPVAATAARGAAHAGHDAPAHGRPSHESSTRGQRNAAERVRAATAQFADPDVAVAAGYNVQFPPGCATLGDGLASQGFHYLNPSLAGDTKIDLLRPELVMYEPQADGSLQLVGVDYVVPFDLWKSPQPPVLLGMPFMRNEPLSVWALHIWTERENSDGLFAAWNPDVSCEHAGIADLPALP